MFSLPQIINATCIRTIKISRRSMASISVPRVGLAVCVDENWDACTLARGPGVRPRSVSYSGRRAAMDGWGVMGGDGLGWSGGRAELGWWSTFAEWL